MRSDLRHAIRLLSRAPGFTLAVVLILALGIGANSAIFAALDKTVIRPLPYADPDRLAMLWEDFSAFGTARQRVSPATFADWRRRTASFQELAAWAGPVTLDLAGGGPPEEVLGQFVTANLIPMLGVSPLLGRSFTADEERPASHLVILSHRLWQRRYHGDAAIVGAAIPMSGEKFTVVGIMPPGFHYPDRQTEFWTPMGLQPQVLASRNSHFLKVAGRLRPGRDHRQAQNDMSSVARRLAVEYPRSNDRIGIAVVGLKEEVLGQSRTAFLILLSAAACLLLIACANVGNLLLARASGRRREIAVRIALGAAPGRIFRQILTENLLLSGAGGSLGLLFAKWSLAVLQDMVPAGLAASGLRLDARVLLVTAGVSILTGVFFGLAPAMQLSRVKLASRGAAGYGNRKLRDVLVVAELAIALVLVIGAGLLIQTLARLRAVDAGFRSDHILTADIAVPHARYGSAPSRQSFYTRVLERVRAIPGVTSAGLTSDLPYTSRGNTMGLAIEGRPAQSGLGQDALFRLVSADYLATIGARLIQGRFLSDQDSAAAVPAVVVNETLARRYWPGGSSLGHRIDTGTGNGQPLWMTIVGVVADVREPGLDLAMKPAVYVPFTQTTISFFQPSEIAIRTARDPMSLSRELQQSVWSVDAEQPVSNIRTMDAIVDAELAGRTQVLQLLGAFAALAVVLAALGIYGVLSYVVGQRTREIGVRMAIGATQWEIVRAILAYVARLTAVGLACGIIAAIAATRLLSTLLFGVSPLDLRVFVVVSVLLASVAFLASYLPTRRAASVDPMVALREE